MSTPNSRFWGSFGSASSCILSGQAEARGHLKHRQNPSPPSASANAPQPFEGFTKQPHCAACEPEANHPPPPPQRRPEPRPPTNRRPGAIDPSLQCCPHWSCAYRGGLGLGNIRANAHPSGGPWRQLSWRSGQGDFLEPHGTLLHGKRLSVELSVRVLACLADGLDLRATARVLHKAPCGRTLRTAVLSSGTSSLHG